MAKRKNATATVEKEEETVIQNSNVAEETVATPSESSKKNNVKFYKFDKAEAREFLLDGNFLSVTMFKKFDFSFYTDASIDLVGVKAKIVKNVNRVLSIMKISDSIAYEHDSELRYNGINTVFTVLVPISDRLNLISQNIYRMVKSLENEGDNVSYRIRSRAIAKIHVNKDAGDKSQYSFFKGFVGISHEFAKTGPDGKEMGNSKNYIKTGAFIDSDVGLSGKEISQFNQFNLTLNKINLFNETQSKYNNEYDYYLNFRKKFRLVIYKLFFNAEDKLSTETKILTISLKSQNVIQTSEMKVIVGTFITKDVETKEIGSLDEVFVNPEGKNYLLDETNVDENSFEFKTFESEISTIGENIISQLSVPTKDDEPSDAASEEVNSEEVVEETSVNESETIKTEDLIDEDDE